MCVNIRRSTMTWVAPWDHDRRSITIPAVLSPQRGLLAVRAVLMELGVQQPEEGAVCWCGDRIAAADLRVLAIRTVTEEATSGA